MVFNVLNTLLKSKAIIGGATAVTAGYVAYNDNTRYSKLAEQFAKGSLFGPHSTYETCYFHRPALEDNIKQILKPTFTHSYHIINGEVGSGKTRTLVEITKKEIETNGKKHNGAPIYVLVSQGSNFADTLAKSIGFKFDEHISFKFLIMCLVQITDLPKTSERKKLGRVLQAFEQAAFIYKYKYSQPAVLVIDGLDVLHQSRSQGKEAIHKLQQKAKLWADTNVCKVVFVVNTKRTMDLLQEDKSSWERSSQPLTVGDLNKEDSIKYLTDSKLFGDDESEKKQINREEATRVYDLVGGRIQHLKTSKHLIMEGHSFNDTKRMLIIKEREKFNTLTRNSDMWKGIKLLLKSPQRTLPLSQIMNKTSVEAMDILDHQDIIRLQQSRLGTLVKFHSSLTAHVAMDMDKNYESVTSYFTASSMYRTVINFVSTLLFRKPALISENELNYLLAGDE